MPRFSSRVLSSPKSAIREMLSLQTGMSDIVSFAIGEPDFNISGHVKDAIIESLNRKETNYTPNAGIPSLLEAIQNSYKSRGLDYSTDNLIVTPGATCALQLAFQTLADEGDEVILPDPYWANYHGMALQVGAVPVFVPLKEENQFMMDPKDLLAAITDKTKFILINSPSNPTGGIINKDILEEIAKIAIEHDLFVVSDEIYRELLWTDEPYTSIASIPGMKERTILIDGFSKTYAMTGLRLGYLASSKECTALARKAAENIFACVNESFQHGGVAALTGSQEDVVKMQQAYLARREIMVSGLNAIPNISCIEPYGAFYAFANISKTGLTSKEFSVRLLQEKGVVVVPGDGFGEAGEGYIRLSYATDEATIREGLIRMKAFAEELAAK